MARLDTERQKELEPQRMENAKEEFERLGYKIISETANSLQIIFKNEIVYFFPYTGWASGKSIKDGRGLYNLLKQLK